MSPRRGSSAVAVLAAAALALAGCADDDDARGQDGEAGTAETRQQDAPSDGPARATGIPEIIEEVAPSVVAVRSASGMSEGEGSGVVWDESRIVTNAHVVQGARQVGVTLASGARLDATVEAADPRTDVAVLRTERDDLLAPDYAEDLPRVGERAIALGNPLGFEDTATAGIVSGMDRAIPTGGQTPSLVGLIQTDAAISPGNSGGALVGASGEVIGINVAYIPPQAQAVAIGFAIPSPEVRHVVESLLENGEVEHSYLGVTLAPLTPQTAEQLDIDDDRGAVVMEAVQGEPAARAGVESGDVIVAMGGDRVERVEDVYATLRQNAPGDTIEVTVVREGEERTLEVTLGSRPD